MGLAKQMSCLLCNDSGTAWMFEFMGVKTLKIFGVTILTSLNDKSLKEIGHTKSVKQ